MIDYDNSAWMARHMTRWYGSVIPRSLFLAVPSGLIGMLLIWLNENYSDFQEHFGSDGLTVSQLWAALTGTLIFAVGFRTHKAYSRFWEGTTLLHQMRGEWFDAVSCLVAFSSLAKKGKPDEVNIFRHTLVRLMSLCHGSALEQIQLDNSDGNFSYIDIGGLDHATLQYLYFAKQQNPAFNMVEVLIHMMQILIVAAEDIKVIKIAPPILSRVFQTLSRGQVNLMNCSKIKATNFPFPFVQLISFLLLLLALLTPTVVSGLVKHMHWAFICSFIPIFGLCALNYAAIELEMPFGDDSNDLPLQHMQDEMNTSMLMLIREEGDKVAHTRDNCVMDWCTLRESRCSKGPVSRFLTEIGAASFGEEKQRPQRPAEEKVLQAAVASTAAAGGAGPSSAAGAVPASLSAAGQAGELRALEQAMRSQVQQFDKLSQNIELLVRSNFSLVEHMREGGGNVAGSAQAMGAASSMSSMQSLSPRAASVRRVASNALNNLPSNFDLGRTRTGSPYALGTVSEVSTQKSVVGNSQDVALGEWDVAL